MVSPVTVLNIAVQPLNTTSMPSFCYLCQNRCQLVRGRQHYKERNKTSAQRSIAFKSHTSAHDFKLSLDHNSEISEALNYVSQTCEELVVRAMPWRVQNSGLQLLSFYFPATTSPNKSQQTIYITALLTSYFAVAPKGKPCQSQHQSVGKPE